MTAMYIRVEQWPNQDRCALAAAYRSVSIFDESGGKASHFSRGTRIFIESSYGRWLKFIKLSDPRDLDHTPEARITRQRVRAYIRGLNERVRESTTHNYVSGLLLAVQVMFPDANWSWLRRITSRLAACAEPLDRFHHLVPPWQTLDLGLRLMDGVVPIVRGMRLSRHVQYRDGLMIALLSLWPIRRRSFAALTISNHVVREVGSISLRLRAVDTKTGCATTFHLPALLLPYVDRYLDDIHPRLSATNPTDGFWTSCRGGHLSACRIYDSVRRLISAEFNRSMCLHDFRRAAATFVAMDAPEMVGLIPGILQHASPEISQKHYNLARSSAASRRYATLIRNRRRELLEGMSGAKYRQAQPIPLEPPTACNPGHGLEASVPLRGLKQ